MARPDLLVDIGAPVHQLAIRDAFEQLGSEEKLYAHWMREAGVQGARIVMHQVSPESEKIVQLVLELARACEGDWVSLGQQTGIDHESLERFLEYGATVLENLGNYKGYGDRKLLPRLELDTIEKLCKASRHAQYLLESIADSIFSESPAAIGYPDESGMSNYYPSEAPITKSEIEELNSLLTRHLELRNTRLVKNKEGNEAKYDLLIASERTTPLSDDDGESRRYLEGLKIRLAYGDHSEALREMCIRLENAQMYAGSEVRSTYLQNLIASFKTGSIEDHKKASIFWVQDNEPNVEAWSGFLESGRDPSGIRCEFEAFVTVKDKSWTKAFNELAEQAREYIAKLPWVNSTTSTSLGDFEKEQFTRPGFVALNLLCYCASNVWTGITGPGYTDVVDKYGRKNLTFSNRVSANGAEREIEYIQDDDAELFRKLHSTCFFVQLAGHELLGHGCGRLFKEDDEGRCNFDQASPPVCPISKEPIQSWYKPGETPESVFGGLYTAYDECLAEGIGLFLMSEKALIETLLPGTSVDYKDVITIGYLSIAAMGVRALESYDLEGQKWGQVHDRARFGLLKCLYESGDELLTVTSSLQPEPTLKLHMDPGKIERVGRRALGELILRLQVYKATRNQSAGAETFTRLTAVDGQYVEWAKIAHAKRKPRTLFIHANTVLREDSSVELLEYPATKEGLIQSWVDRNLFHGGVTTKTNLSML